MTFDEAENQLNKIVEYDNVRYMFHAVLIAQDIKTGEYLYFARLLSLTANSVMECRLSDVKKIF